MQRPLLSCWRISAPALPDELLPASPAPGFTLPGASELLAFADLLGEENCSPSPSQDEVPVPDPPSAPFQLPALLPDALSGEATLFCSIDFGTLHGDRAVLTFQQLLGRGTILLGETPVATFDSTRPSLSDSEKASVLSAAPCAFAVDLSAALRCGRRETLSIHFDNARPAGVCGAVFLQTSQYAVLSRLALSPDAAHQTVTIRAQVTADRAGDYILRALPILPDPSASPLPARDVTLSLSAGESRQTEMTLSVPSERFVPGKAYAAPVIRVCLLRMLSPGSRRSALCDSAILAFGYSGRAPLSYLPLCENDLLTSPQALVQSLLDLNLHGVQLSVPASEIFYLAMTRAGIGVIQQLEENSPHRDRLARHACITFSSEKTAVLPLSPAAAAWQLCGMTGYSRAVDPNLSAQALLYEAAGRSLDPLDESVCDVLEWLRAVFVRLRCEAARQGRYIGALCDAEQWKTPDVCAAVRTAFSPLHLSALPLSGAWWTGTRFSAMLEAFIPEGKYTGKSLDALAVLEDGEGHELARLFMPCRAKGGYVGVLDAQLPNTPCVLDLRTQLLCGEEIIEESTLPVYIGERGPLEAAFI